MGALAPISPWIPEDDLLLKNAVEDGASLESLAKGAVQFSQRFTLRELQERWHCLLYDPVISAEASARMLEYELSSGITSKSSTLESSKVGKGDQKRKVQSIRRCYYAMRKRICTDPLDQGGLNFLAPPVENCFGSENEALGPGGNFEDPIGNHFQLENADFDGLHHVLNEDATNNMDEISHDYDNGHGGQIGNHPFEQGHLCEEMPHVDHNVPLGGTCSAVGGIVSLKAIPLQIPFKDNMDMHPIINSDSSNFSMYTGLEGNHVFSSPVSECEATFHHLPYSSSPPEMPVWTNMDSMSGMEMSGDSQLGGENPHSGGPFGIPDDAGNGSSGFAVVSSETDFHSHIVALSDRLLSFSDDDDMLLMDDDGTEIDKYGLSNLLLDSPADVNEDQMLNVTEADTSVVPVTDLCVPSSISTDQVNKGADDVETSGLEPVLEVQKPSSKSDMIPQSPKLLNGVICCTLNTEDLEVPNNDHLVFSVKSRLTSSSRRGFSELRHPALSIKDILHKQVSDTGLSLMHREMKKFGELHADSQARGQKTGFKHTGTSDTRVEPPKSENCSAKMKHPGSAISTFPVKGAASNNFSGKKSCSDLPVKVSEGLNGCFEGGGPGVKEEVFVVLSSENPEAPTQSGTADGMVPEPVGESLSDVEEQFSDDDADTPYFSDIESMILDMDLGPEDLDLLSSKQVEMYQSEDAERAIIRLEQGAHACMQRAIAFHGAFAVLYSRHSKHYIKKPEVLIGRATEDFGVDIDLGKEGRANKISRRQAVIKMSEDGAFHLKNLGRCTIFVDDKDVYPGQSLVLHSNCLIEIREMPFIFENNQAQVKRHLDSIPHHPNEALL